MQVLFHTVCEKLNWETRLIEGDTANTWQTSQFRASAAGHRVHVTFEHVDTVQWLRSEFSQKEYSTDLTLWAEE